jgi:MFS family permease
VPGVRLLAIAGLQALAITGLSSLLPAYLSRSGASDFVVGLSFTAWAVARGGFGLVAGRLYARAGARRLLALALGLFAATTLAYALSRSALLLVAWRLLQGVAAGLYWTALLAAAGEGVAPEARLTSLVRVNVVAATAGLASNALAGAVAAAWSPRTFFWMESGLLTLGIPLALGLPAQAPQRARRAGRALRPTGLGWREVAAATEGGDGHARRRRRPLRRTPGPVGASAARSGTRGGTGSRGTGQRRWQIALAAVGNLPLVVTMAGTPVLLLRTGAGYPLIGAVGALMVLANIGAQTAAGRLRRRWGTRRVLAGAGTVASASLILLAAGHGVAATVVACVLLSAALSLSALTWLSWVQLGAEAAEVGAVTGLFRGIGDLSAVVGYTAFGLISAHLRPSLALLALLALVSGGGALAVAEGGEAPHRPARG